MKTKMVALLFVLLISNGFIPQAATAQVSVNFQVFYDELSPYGTWVNNSDYGYVWVPDVAPGFTPYGTNGYWLLTNDGWTWVSNYSWGWAPFHYGRWYTDPNYGPMWVPDNEWGPGWVTWRRSEGYYGWAPIGPGVSMSFAYSSSYNVPYNQWVFVRGENFGRTNINNYYVNSSNNVTIIHNSTVINNFRDDKTHNVSYNAGPDRKEVEKHAGKKFTPVAIKESSKPGQKLNNNQLEVYRPKLQKNNSGGAKPAPTKVASMKDLKRAPQKDNEVAPQKRDAPKKEQPNKAQPNNEQPSQQQHNSQLKKEQPKQEQHKAQPNKDQPSQQQQHNSQPNKEQPKKEQPQQEQHKAQPNKEQPSQQQQHDSQPKKQKQGGQSGKQQQHNNQPNKEQHQQKPDHSNENQQPH